MGNTIVINAMIYFKSFDIIKRDMYILVLVILVCENTILLYSTHLKNFTKTKQGEERFERESLKNETCISLMFIL